MQSMEDQMSQLRKRIDGLRNEITLAQSQENLKDFKKSINSHKDSIRNSIRFSKSSSSHKNCTSDMHFLRNKRKGGFSCILCQELLAAGHSTGNCKHHQSKNQFI